MMSGCDIMDGRRNRKIEEELQSTLDNGGNVWVIGDVVKQRGIHSVKASQRASTA